jgi:excisionase family DNA binding protein
MVTQHNSPHDYRQEGGQVPTPSGFATVLEAAHFLRLSRQKVHLMLRAGEIPHTRYGRSVRVPWNWLRAQAEGQ